MDVTITIVPYQHQLSLHLSKIQLFVLNMKGISIRYIIHNHFLSYTDTHSFNQWNGRHVVFLIIPKACLYTHTYMYTHMHVRRVLIIHWTKVYWNMGRGLYKILHKIMKMKKKNSFEVAPAKFRIKKMVTFCI